MPACLFALLLAGPAVAQGLSPTEAVRRMTLPPGFSVTCVAYEPTIRQPLSLSFDHRGRLWVLQFLQYPNPAGLKPVRQDRYLRTVWDRVPEPPPHGPKGLDRLTILSDPDERGLFRKATDFVSGLNLASGFCLAPDGVYVAQPPYLLFYPDRDHDDRPDGTPDVLLSGFGLDDTHSLVNSLQWGPDGWLYGAAGSTSTCRVTDPSGHAKQPIEFQQGLWRYHPQTRRFELFSEGGGNTYGLDFDRTGQALAGTNWGGFALLHQRQGAYHIKGFSKHGPLHNPHAYGYFDHVPYRDFQGGHVTCGGISYQASTFPAAFRDQYVAGNLLSNTVNWHRLTPQLSSFLAEHGGVLLDSHDPWFRPVDVIQGPDGSVYVADWHDRRAAHLDPVDDWDKSNGRVYRIDYQGWKNPGSFDLRRNSTAELTTMLGHENVWWRRTARMELQTRKATVPKSGPQPDTFWTNPDSFTPDELTDPTAREWWVRLALDQTAQPTPTVERHLLALPLPAGHHGLLAQYAASAKRANPLLATAMVARLLPRKELADDPALALLTWWAVEAHLNAEPDKLTETVLAAATSNAGATPVFERTVRKLLAVGNTDAACRWSAAALRTANPTLITVTVSGVEAALDTGIPQAHSQLAVMLKAAGSDERFLRLLAKCGDADARARAVSVVRDERAKDGDRLKWLTILARSPNPDLDLHGLLTRAKSDPWRMGLIAALEAGDSPTTSDALLAVYPQSSPTIRRRIIRALLVRPGWAVALLRGNAAADLDVEDARAALTLSDPTVTQLVEQRFGKVAVATPGEKRARIDSLATMLSREPTGDPAAGKQVFARQCEACHQLHGVGGTVGPDLTSVDRKSRTTLLTHIVDPSGSIRPEFISHKVERADGRSVSGRVTAQSAESLTVVSWQDGKPVTEVVLRRDVERIEPLAVSLMPEKLLDTLSHADICNLFAFLQADPMRPPPAARKKWTVALISGSLEYKSDESLAGFQKLLEASYPVDCVRMFRRTDTDITGLDKLADCDLAIFFTRRLSPTDSQLSLVKKYVESGKPIVGIRTASHGFQNWLAMDQEVFGGDYKNHWKAGPRCEVAIVDRNREHPILRGVRPFGSPSSLYKNEKVAADVTVLLTGSTPLTTEPVAWTRERAVSGQTQRIFYTSLGHQDDFAERNFRQLLVNAIGWCLRDEATFRAP